MKVIAHTHGGYIVEMSGTELANAAGHSYEYKTPWFHRSDRMAPIGGEFSVSPVFLFLDQLRNAEDQTRTCASTMRALAELLERTLPTAYLPPAPDEAPAPTQAEAQ
jgi:hypothetical protein